jgi:hypothetical protein
LIHDRRRKRYQCKNCRHQTTLTAGTIFEATKLSLTIWFQAIYVISQAKTGLSALALKRQLGVSYPTSWMIHHKLMHAMQRRDDHYLLGGLVQIDDAYLGGELSGGKAGRGSENKVPFVAAVEFNDNNADESCKWIHNKSHFKLGSKSSCSRDDCHHRWLGVFRGGDRGRLQAYCKDCRKPKAKRTAVVPVAQHNPRQCEDGAGWRLSCISIFQI